MDHLCYFGIVFCYAFVCLFINALWSPAGTRLTSWVSFQFPLGILGQLWCLIVSIPDRFPLSYFWFFFLIEYRYIAIIPI